MTQSYFGLVVPRLASLSPTKQFVSGNSKWNTRKESAMELTKCGPTSQVLGQKISSSLAALPETRRLVVTAALDKLFTENYFSVCTVDNILKILNVSKNSDAYRLLQALHCVDYGAMPKELRDTLPDLVREAITPAYEPQHATDTALMGIQF